MLVGIDCDLRELTVVSDTGEQFQGDAPLVASALARMVHAAGPLGPVTLLYEIAGAVDYTDNKGAAHNKRRWTIFNVAMAQHLHDRFRRGLLFRCDFLVAPSNVWTKGYTEKQRHDIFQCDASTHDLRECQAMMGAYRRAPEAWVPLPQFLNNL